MWGRKSAAAAARFAYVQQFLVTKQTTLVKWRQCLLELLEGPFNRQFGSVTRAKSKLLSGDDSFGQVRCVLAAFLLQFYFQKAESITVIFQFYFLKSAAKLLCHKTPLSCCSFLRPKTQQDRITPNQIGIASAIPNGLTNRAPLDRFLSDAGARKPLFLQTCGEKFVAGGFVP